MKSRYGLMPSCGAQVQPETNTKDVILKRNHFLACRINYCNLLKLNTDFHGFLLVCLRKSARSA
jgi:hypothetical protein